MPIIFKVIIFAAQFCNNPLNLSFMDTYLIKVFDGRTCKDTEVLLCGINQVIGALNFISQDSNLLSTGLYKHYLFATPFVWLFLSYSNNF